MKNMYRKTELFNAVASKYDALYGLAKETENGIVSREEFSLSFGMTTNALILANLVILKLSEEFFTPIFVKEPVKK